MSNVVTTNGVAVTTAGQPWLAATLQKSFSISHTINIDASLAPLVEQSFIENYIQSLELQKNIQKSFALEIGVVSSVDIESAGVRDFSINNTSSVDIEFNKAVESPFDDAVVVELDVSPQKNVALVAPINANHSLDADIDVDTAVEFSVDITADIDASIEKGLENSFSIDAQHSVEAGTDKLSASPFDIQSFTDIGKEIAIQKSIGLQISINQEAVVGVGFLVDKTLSISLPVSARLTLNRFVELPFAVSSTSSLELSIDKSVALSPKMSESQFMVVGASSMIEKLLFITQTLVADGNFAKMLVFFKNITVTSAGTPLTANGQAVQIGGPFDTTARVSTETLLEQQKISPLQIALEYVAGVSLAPKFEKFILLVIEQLQAVLLEQDKFVSDNPATFNTIFTEKQSLKILEVQKDIGVDSRAGDKIFVSKAVDLALNILQEQLITLDELKSVLKDLTIDQTIELLFTVVRTRPSLVLGPIGIASRMRLEPSNTQRSELDPSNTQLSRIDFSGERKKLIVKSAQNKKFLAIRRIFSGAERYVVPEEE